MVISLLVMAIDFVACRIVNRGIEANIEKAGEDESFTDPD